MVDIYSKKKHLPGGCNFKTVKELNELLTKGLLTSDDLDYIYALRSEWHKFRADRGDINSVSGYHNTEPSAIIFLDIKGTLYDGGTHGSSRSLLARSPLGDYKPIQYDMINAFGDMIKRTIPQDFICDYIIGDGYEIVPKSYAYDTLLVERHPFEYERRFQRPNYITKNGPFTVVFVSSDSVETQKNIVALLYYMAIYIDRMNALENICSSFKKEDKFIDGVISKIEHLLYLKYNNDFMRFLEYEDQNFAQLAKEEFEMFKKTIDGLYFLSTIPDNPEEPIKTKEQLMREFLRSKTIYHCDYGVYAFGDDYGQDGGMLRTAFMYGGFGLMRGDSSHMYSGKYVDLIRDLSEEGINLCYLPIVDSFTCFYNMLINELVMKRENELIEAMICANQGIVDGRVLPGLCVPCCLRKVNGSSSRRHLTF